MDHQYAHDLRQHYFSRHPLALKVEGMGHTEYLNHIARFDNLTQFMQFCHHFVRAAAADREVLLFLKRLCGYPNANGHPKDWADWSGISADAQAHGAISPWRLAQLAAHAAGLQGALGLPKEDVEAMGPTTLQEALAGLAIVNGNQAIDPANPAGHLKLVVSLVDVSDTDGGLAQMRLWRTDRLGGQLHNLQSPSASPKLIQAPAAAQLLLDDGFRQCIEHVDKLMALCLKPSAPTVAWDYRPLSNKLEGRAWCVAVGASATAQMALGVLHLLRDHFDFDRARPAAQQEELLQLHDAVQLMQPSQAVVSAQLTFKGRPGKLLPGLDRIEGLDDKAYAALVNKDDFPQALQHLRPKHFFVSERQTGAVLEHGREHNLPIHKVDDLLGLAREHSTKTAFLTSPAAMRVYRYFESCRSPSGQHQEPLPFPSADDLDVVANDDALCRKSMQGYLLHSAVKYLTGQLQPFSEPMQLHQQFVNLTLEITDEPLRQKLRETQADKCFLSEDGKRLTVQSLSELLLTHVFEAVPAWCLTGKPFAGKTTLLAHWHASTASHAIAHWHDRNEAGQAQPLEFCVFIPMKELVQQGDAKLKPKAFRKRLVAALKAKGPPDINWVDWLETGQLAQPGHMRCRLLLDGMNELVATDETARRTHLETLIKLLAQARQNAPDKTLPPVLSVRELEISGSLTHAPGGQGGSQPWRAHFVRVESWGAQQVRQYIQQRSRPTPHQPHGLPAEQAHRLLEALGLRDEVTDSSPSHSSLNDSTPDSAWPGSNKLAQMLSTPGFLSAQCTVLTGWPTLRVAERPADLMQQLVWHLMLKSRSLLHLNQLGRSIQRTLDELHAMQLPLAAERWWVLPTDAQARGPLLQGLCALAGEMHGSQGFTGLSMRWDGEEGRALQARIRRSWVPDEGKKRPPINGWKKAAKALGLLVFHIDGEKKEFVSFVHQQWAEFFAALDVTWQKVAPHKNKKPAIDLSPAPLDPPTEEALSEHFDANPSARLTLRQVGPQHERMRYAADLCPTAAHAVRLIASVLQQTDDRGLPVNLHLAAQLAIDQRERIEPRPEPSRTGIAWDGHWFERDVNRSTGRHPLLQLIRKLLLLNSVDGGRRVDYGYSVKYRIGNSGVLESLHPGWRHDAALPAPITLRRFPQHNRWANDLQGLELWCQHVFDRARSKAFKGSGVDVRDRIALGMALGRLGDNLRYLRVQVTLAGGEGRTPGQMALIRLKDQHFIQIGKPRKKSNYIIGDNLHGYEYVKPQWVAELPGFKAAALKVTKMEFQAYEEAVGDYNAHRDPSHPHHPVPQTLPLDEHQCNPLQPMVRINWHDAVRMGQFMSAHAQLMGCRLPTEVEYEGALRGPASSGLRLDDEQGLNAHVQQTWTTPSWHDGIKPERFDFNHENTRLMQAAPVGVFPASHTAYGQADGSGNVWTWCANLPEADESGNMVTWAAQAARKSACLAVSLTDVLETDDREKSPWVAVRGGSFNFPSLNSQLSFRSRLRATFRNVYVGLSWVVARPP